MDSNEGTNDNEAQGNEEMNMNEDMIIGENIEGVSSPPVAYGTRSRKRKQWDLVPQQLKRLREEVVNVATYFSS